MTLSLLADWTESDFQTLERGVLVARHRLAETGLFTDEALAKILDTHPAESLSISTMGHDTNRFEWREGDRNGTPGDVLLELVRENHLWINCRKMLVHQPEYAKVINSVYDELEANQPGFQARDRTANLLISSPGALVHYHVDLPVNMLWHIRGTKRVWVYPHFDYRFIAPHVLEKVCSGELTEDVPYDAEFRPVCTRLRRPAGRTDHLAATRAPSGFEPGRSERIPVDRAQESAGRTTNQCASCQSATSAEAGLGLPQHEGRRASGPLQADPRQSSPLSSAS